MNRKQSWPWQPRHNPLPPPVHTLLSLVGWGLVVLAAYVASTYLLDFFIA